MMDNAFKKTINAGSDAYYKNQMENITKENKLLKYKLDVLERENKDLKKSIYDLSVRYDMLMHQMGKTAKPFNIESIFENYIPGRDINIVDTNADETTDQIPESTSTRKVDERHFYYKYTLKGHTGAVYTAMFSPCGKYIASGSFDKTARIWDIANQHEATVLSGHSHSVSEVTWSKDSQELLTGGFDKTVRLWDISHAQMVKGYLTSGFVQAVAFHPTDANIFFASNTHKKIIVFDRRQARCVAIFENDSMVNTMQISKGGNHILSGDARGFLKVWDTRVALSANSGSANGSKVPARVAEPEIDDSTQEGDAVLTGQCVDAEPFAPRPAQGGVVDSLDIGDSNKPISHVHFSKGNDSEVRYLAVNSYSNVLRVYDRGAGALKTMALIGTFSSHKNQNWPIKSSFFVGKEYQSTLTQEEANSKDEDDEEETSIDINASFLIATGSADNNAYIYDVGRSSKEGGKVLQRLEGHTDKVYSVNFHPFEPIIASCSSDFTVRLWSPRKKLYV
eukprot:Phypoly_transcript_06258.p1 GENE.Phypoly_transcript_06258~~Phypoly_transcript_06258.p1  ORF type:complete len:508 (+),score=83.16 Phypoly_transcript_06258:139-1662(+)